MGFQEFLYLNFVYPLYHEAAGYNIYNTLVYGIILAVAVLGVYKLLQKLEVKIDTQFFIATTPFIVFASVLRVLENAQVFATPWLVSPLIYFLDFAITLGILLLTLKLSKLLKIEYYKIMSTIGVLLVGAFALYLKFPLPKAFAQIFGITAVVGIVLYGLYKFKPEIFTPMNSFILLAALFDAASTVVGVELYGYGEKHVLPNFLFGLTGSAWIMFPLKFFVILGALYVIDTTEEDSFFKNFIKFAILAVTLGPGARNTIRLAAGV